MRHDRRNRGGDDMPNVVKEVTTSNLAIDEATTS
jgi:hypothetical protein